MFLALYMIVSTGTICNIALNIQQRFSLAVLVSEILKCFHPTDPSHLCVSLLPPQPFQEKSII